MPLVRRVVVTSLLLGAVGYGGYTSFDDLLVRTASAEPEVDLTSATSFTLTGGGYGHGHGMSQHGAAGAAQQGLDHRKILAFYYPGTTLATQSRTISVLLSADTTSDVAVVARSGLKVTQLAPRRTLTLPKRGTRWRLVGASRGRTVLARLVDGRWRTWRTLRGAAEFHASGPVSLVLPNGRTAAYRGRLRSALPSPQSVARDTVNVLNREDYLRGVVPAEMPASWPAAAVRSQAVAARTYAAHEQNHPLARHYQVCDTTRCQVYRGVAGEHPLGDAAIRATANQVLLYQGSPAFTQFSASNGGWSSTGSRPYLVAQEDPYDAWRGNTVNRWTVTVQRSTLRSLWPRAGRPTSVKVISRDGEGEWGGRVQKLQITGRAGTVTVSGDEVRRALGLRSTYFTPAAAAPNAG